jgi:phenylpropionate dioxygenase-like ring-hydroxylating dioxygenase large terminal subunit
VHPDPEGDIDADALLGDLAPEFHSWNFGRLAYTSCDTYDMSLNWKLAMGTFGETYHFPTLHRDSLAQAFHGNVQAYDTFGRNHRMLLCLRNIDTLRGTPEERWYIVNGGLPVYYLFPNVQLNVGEPRLTMVRTYPDPSKAGHSISRVSFYFEPDILAEASRRGTRGPLPANHSRQGLHRCADFSTRRRSGLPKDRALRAQ